MNDQRREETFRCTDAGDMGGRRNKVWGGGKEWEGEEKEGVCLCVCVIVGGRGGKHWGWRIHFVVG